MHPVTGTGRLVSTFLVLFVGAPRSWPAAIFPPPDWAYPQTPRDFKPDPDDRKPKRLLGGARAYTFSHIEDSFAPADWYPAEHPRMPEVPVARGRKPDVRACSGCHLPNGVGHPQSANLTGLSPDYLLADFKSGARAAKTTELMKPVASQLTLQQMIDVAAYLGSSMP